jgi:type IV pilus assembly protein PilZ
MTQRTKDRRAEEKGVGKDRRSGADRRRYQRILVDLEVDYQCEDTFLFAYITDLSVLGIFVRTNNPEPPGTHLNLRFTLPGDEKPLELEGEVIWINPFRPGAFDNINPGMGVRFNEMSKEIKAALMHLVRKIAYLEGDASGATSEGSESAAPSEPQAHCASSVPRAEDSAAGRPNSSDEEIPIAVEASGEKKIS